MIAYSIREFWLANDGDDSVRRCSWHHSMGKSLYNLCCETLRIIMRPSYMGIIPSFRRLQVDVLLHGSLCSPFILQYLGFFIDNQILPSVLEYVFPFSWMQTHNLNGPYCKEMEYPSNGGEQSPLQMPSAAPSLTSLEPTPVISGSEESGLVRKEKSGKSVAWDFFMTPDNKDKKESGRLFANEC